MFNKCLYINAYVQKPISEGKVASKMFEIALRTDSALDLRWLRGLFLCGMETVGHWIHWIMLK